MLDRRRVGEAVRLAPFRGHCEHFAVDHKGDRIFIGGQGIFADIAGVCGDFVGVELVIGVHLDRQFSRFAINRGDNPEVAAAFVDDPLAVAADASAANVVLGVLRQGLGGAHGTRRRGGRVDVHLENVGRIAQRLGDIKEFLAIRRPHRRNVLAVEGRQLFDGRAIRRRKPDVVVRGSAIAFAVPGARAAHKGDRR